MGFVRAIGSARLTDENGAKHQIHAMDFEVSIMGGRSRTHGEERIWSARIDHDELGPLEFSIAEYPPGVLNHDLIRANVNANQLNRKLRFSYVDINSPIETRPETEARISKLVDSVSHDLLFTESDHDFSTRVTAALTKAFPEDAALAKTAVEELLATREWDMSELRELSPEELESGVYSILDQLDDTSAETRLDEVIVPSQSKVGAKFEPNETCWIALRKENDTYEWKPALESSLIVIFEELEELGEALAPLQNAHPHLCSAVQRYINAISERKTPERLNLELNRLKLSTANAMESAAKGNVPEVSELAQLKLDNVFQASHSLAARSESWSDLLEAERIAARQFDAKTVKILATKIEKALPSGPEIDPDVIEVMSEIASCQELPEQTKGYAVGTLGNFLKNIASLGTFGKVATNVASPIIAAGLVGSGFGGSAVVSISSAFDFSAYWMMANFDIFHSALAIIGPDTYWLKDLANVFRKPFSSRGNAE